MAFKELIPWKRKDLSTGREEDFFDSLYREMNHVLDRFTHGFGREEGWGGAFPVVNVSETENEVVVTAELPGMDEKDLDLSLRGNQLIIRGEKKEEKEEKGEHYYRKESSYGSFHRVIPLPMEVDEDKIEATYKKGVLKIRLPKSAEAQKNIKKIDIH